MPPEPEFPTLPRSKAWRYAAGELVLDRPRIMAILNITPDSFYGASRKPEVEPAVKAARAALQSGADLLDVGGESTRPGSQPVAADEQIRRVVPVISALRAAGIACPISIDTTRAPVAQAALDAGADVINDVSAGSDDPDIFRLAADRRAGLILMHRRVAPPQDHYSDSYAAPPAYSDVVAEVAGFLAARAAAAIAAGVEPTSIVTDPGLGFGKTVSQNLELLRGTPRLGALGFPVLSALSRKSFVGRVSLGRESSPEERLAGTLALSVMHLAAGARIFRVHDVPEHLQALRAAWAARSNTEQSTDIVG